MIVALFIVIVLNLVYSPSDLMCIWSETILVHVILWNFLTIFISKLSFLYEYSYVWCVRNFCSLRIQLMGELYTVGAKENKNQQKKEMSIKIGCRMRARLGNLPSMYRVVTTVG